MKNSCKNENADYLPGFVKSFNSPTVYTPDYYFLSRIVLYQFFVNVGTVEEVENIINDGISLMVLDSKEKIVGILFSFTLKRDEFKAKSSFDEYRKSFPHAQAVIRAMYDELLYPGDVFEKYPDVTKICNMFALATLPNYRGKYVRADFCTLN